MANLENSQAFRLKSSVVEIVFALFQPVLKRDKAFLMSHPAAARSWPEFLLLWRDAHQHQARPAASPNQGQEARKLIQAISHKPSLTLGPTPQKFSKQVRLSFVWPKCPSRSSLPPRRISEAGHDRTSSDALFKQELDLELCLQRQYFVIHIGHWLHGCCLTVSSSKSVPARPCAYKTRPGAATAGAALAANVRRVSSPRPESMARIAHMLHPRFIASSIGLQLADPIIDSK